MAQLNVITSDGTTQTVNSTSSDIQQTATSTVTAPANQAASTNNDKVMNFLSAEASTTTEAKPKTTSLRYKVLVGGISLSVAIFATVLLIHYKQIIHKKLNSPKA